MQQTDTTIKIAHCVPLELATHGGVETHIRCLARALRQLGLSVDLFGKTQSQPGTAEPFFGLNDFDYRRYDIIHTHGGFLPPKLLSYLTGRRSSQRHIHTTHNIALDYLVACRTPLNWRCYTATAFEWFWSRHADHVITVSHQARQWAIHRFFVPENRVSTVPNGSWPVVTNPQIRSDIRTRLNLSHDHLAGIFVGRGHDRVKGTHPICRVFNQLAQQYPHLKLIALPGSGFEPAPWLIATGLIDHSQVSNYYQAADFFVNASFSEGLPLTLVEAMAASLAVVAAPVGGIPDIIQHGRNGLLTARNRGDLAFQIERLITQPELRCQLGQQAALTAQSLTWDAIAAQTAAIYQLKTFRTAGK